VIYKYNKFVENDGDLHESDLVDSTNYAEFGNVNNTGIYMLDSV
jgi:hypothetical protein